MKNAKQSYHNANETGNYTVSKKTSPTFSAVTRESIVGFS